jgi:hypothetical protein
VRLIAICTRPAASGSEDEQQDRADQTDIVVVAARAAEIETEIGKHGDGPCDGRGERHQQRIAMLDMPELMRQHAGKLIAVHHLHQASGHGDRGVLGVAAQWQTRSAADSP